MAHLSCYEKFSLYSKIWNQNKDVFQIHLLENSVIYFPKRYVKPVDESFP